MDTITTATTSISITGTTSLVLNSFLGWQGMGALPAFFLPFFRMIRTFQTFQIRH